MTHPDPSLFFHHASAFGLSGQIDRPLQQTISTQASVALATGGGHNTQRIEKFQLPGIVSFDAAYVDVGGSLDDTNDTHATYASSVIENLNIFNVIMADRVVSRLTVYHPAGQKKPMPDDAEPNFSIVGSHFDNLRIAGEKINVPLDTATFHDSTYTNFCGGKPMPGGAQGDSIMGSNIDLTKLSPKDHNYAIVKRISDHFKAWQEKPNKPTTGRQFWCSAANHLVSAPANATTGKTGKNSKKAPKAGATTPPLAPVPSTPGLVNFGGIICVPRFGVVYLAELHIYPHHRYLTMFRIHMCSPGGGFVGGGGTGGGGGGGTIPPP